MTKLFESAKFIIRGKEVKAKPREIASILHAKTHRPQKPIIIEAATPPTFEEEMKALGNVKKG